MKALRELYAELSALGYADALHRDEPLAEHTSFAVGGPADLLMIASSMEQLVSAVQVAWRHQMPVRVMGSGTNILVADAGIRGFVVINACAEYRMLHECLIEAQSGTLLRDLALWSVKQGWTGIEWACGIPGTVGGAVVGNAGAYGGYISDVFKEGLVLQRGCGKRVLSREDMNFGYRSSVLKNSAAAQNTIVLSARLQLEPDDESMLRERVVSITEQREARTPRGCCAGSMFKRTARYPAGFLIDQAGLKGFRIGDAQVSTKHANFVMNIGEATAEDVRALISEVQKQVWLTFAEHLEPEVEFVGEW